jgi:hypothetical protein
MPRHVLRTLHDAPHKQRVVIYRREDGSFGFQNERFAVEEQCWIPRGAFSAAHCDTLESAEREARGRVPWLRTAGPAPLDASSELRPPRELVAILEVHYNPATGLMVIPALPEDANYDAVYRSATSVRWNEAARALHMIPRADRSERSPLDAWRCICEAVASEYGDELVLTPHTVYRGLPAADEAAVRACRSAANPRS